MCSSSDIFLCVLAVIFPPIAVWIKRGICSVDSFINIALCCLGFLPGLIHAWYIVSSNPEPAYSEIPQDEEGRYTVVYVTSGGPAPRGATQPTYGSIVRGTPSGGQFPGQQSGTSNYYAQHSAKVAKAAHQPSARPDGPSEEGENSAPPPSYAQVVQGDNKIQT